MKILAMAIFFSSFKVINSHPISLEVGDFLFVFGIKPHRAYIYKITHDNATKTTQTNPLKHKHAY